MPINMTDYKMIIHERIYNVIHIDSIAVMKQYAVTQGEGVDKSVLRDIVAFSHSGDQFTIGAGFHQTLINVE